MYIVSMGKWPSPSLLHFIYHLIQCHVHFQLPEAGRLSNLSCLFLTHIVGILCNFFFLSISCYRHLTMESCFCRVGLVVAKLLSILNPTLDDISKLPKAPYDVVAPGLGSAVSPKDHHINSRLLACLTNTC